MPNSVSLVRDVHTPFTPTSLVAAISVTANLSELVDLVPAPFLARTRTLVNKVYSAAKKSNHARSYLSTLERHNIDHTFPPEIGGRVNTPALQISKEYSASAQSRAEQQLLDTKTREHKEALLLEAIVIKRNEVAYLQSLFAESTYLSEVHSIFADVVAELASDAGITLEQVDQSISTKMLPDWVRADCEAYRQHGKHFPGRAVALAHAANQQEMSKKFKSLSLKRRTDEDVEMTDPSSKNETVQAIVQKELAKAMKELKTYQPPGKRNAKKNSKPQNAKRQTSPRVSKRGQSTSSSGSNGSAKGKWRGRSTNK